MVQTDPAGEEIRKVMEDVAKKVCKAIGINV
jgi:hypothetical protein